MDNVFLMHVLDVYEQAIQWLYLNMIVFFFYNVSHCKHVHEFVRYTLGCIIQIEICICTF